MAAEPPQTKGSASLAIEVSGMVWLSRSSAENNESINEDKIGDVLVHTSYKRVLKRSSDPLTPSDPRPILAGYRWNCTPLSE